MAHIAYVSKLRICCTQADWSLASAALALVAASKLPGLQVQARATAPHPQSCSC